MTRRDDMFIAAIQCKGKLGMSGVLENYVLPVSRFSQNVAHRYRISSRGLGRITKSPVRAGQLHLATDELIAIIDQLEGCTRAFNTAGSRRIGAFSGGAPPVERHLAAILATDVEGYSSLMHGGEEATMATSSARRAVVDQLIGQHRGRIANTAGVLHVE